MIIDQALYGAARSGHSMLVATGDVAIARDLTSRLDLPDTAPYGAKWSPFLTGFPYGQYYVLARVLSDEHASRTGMVFTHALIAQLDEMVKFDNLQNLIDLLCELPCPNNPITRLEVQSQPLAPNNATTEKIAIAMMLVSPGIGPVVRLGNQGFDQVVAELWRRLWPEIRRGFAFRLSFGPGDLVESPLPSLVCTPQNLSARWIGYRIISMQPTPEMLSPAAALLAGAPGGTELFEYASNLGVTIDTFGDLILLERAYTLQKTSNTSFDSSVAQLRVIEALSSGQPTATAGKRDILANVLRLLSGANAAQVLSLRNITLTSMDQPNRLWDGLCQWMTEYRFPVAEDTDIVRLLTGLDDASYAVAKWQLAMVNGLERGKANPSSQVFHAFWRWGSHSPEVYKHVFQCVSLRDTDDVLLAEAAPDRIGIKEANELLSLSASRGLYRLHGVVASMLFPPLEAVRVQLGVQEQRLKLVGIEFAMRTAEPKQVLECALAFHQSQLTELAANTVSLQPTLLSDIDMSDMTAQDIWERALRKNQACWSGPKQPNAAFQMILSAMLDGKREETSLITSLSNTPLADLNGYSRREELWICLSGNTKDRLVAATAAGWLDRIADVAAIPLEAALQSHIVDSPTFTATLRRFVSIGPGAALRLISLLTRVDEQHFVEILPMLTAVPLVPADADALGRLVLTRRWSQAAERLAALFRQRREDIAPAVRASYSLLSFRTRFRLDVVPLSADEKWQALGQVAADLYPSGPDHNDLWRRTGGSDADLRHDGDGRARWADALAKIRRGYDLEVSKLIAQMREDFPGNDELQYLSHEPEFQERP